MQETQESIPGWGRSPREGNGYRLQYSCLENLMDRGDRCESAALNRPANVENSTVATGLEKVSFHSSSKVGNAKDYSNNCTTTLISYASKVMLKILQARLQQYVNHELPDVQVGFRKCRETSDQIASIHWIMEKAREFQKSVHGSRIAEVWLGEF